MRTRSVAGKGLSQIICDILVVDGCNEFFHVSQSCHQILHCRAVTPIGHELKSGISSVLEENTTDVPWATHAGGSHRAKCIKGKGRDRGP